MPQEQPKLGRDATTVLAWSERGQMKRATRDARVHYDGRQFGAGDYVTLCGIPSDDFHHEEHDGAPETFFVGCARCTRSMQKLVRERDAREKERDAVRQGIRQVLEDEAPFESLRELIAKIPEMAPEPPEKFHGEYDAYITELEKNLPRQAFVGACYFLVEGMEVDFPELRPVWGYVKCEHGERWPHWYLKTPSGQIYDPTRSQFDKIEGYGEWPEGEPRPIGCCRKCSKLVPPTYICECGADYRGADANGNTPAGQEAK